MRSLKTKKKKKRKENLEKKLGVSPRTVSYFEIILAKYNDRFRKKEVKQEEHGIGKSREACTQIMTLAKLVNHPLLKGI